MQKNIRIIFPIVSGLERRSRSRRMSNPFAVLTSEETALKERSPLKSSAPVQSGKRDYPTRGVSRGISVGASSTRGDHATKRGGRGGAKRPGKREFDRHSATGKTDSNKKDVAGKGTWGNPTEVIEGTSEGSSEEVAEEEEELAPVKTFEEYKKEQSANVKVGVDTIPEARRPVDSQWKGAKVLKKEDDPELSALMSKKEKTQKNKDKVQNKKVYLNIEQTIVEPKEDRESKFEGRGRGRGSRGARGEGRGEGRSERGVRGSRGSDRGSRGTRGEGRGRGERGSRGGDRGGRFAPRGENSSRGSRGKRGGSLNTQNEKEFPALA